MNLKDIVYEGVLDILHALENASEFEKVTITTNYGHELELTWETLGMLPHWRVRATLPRATPEKTLTWGCATIG